MGLKDWSSLDKAKGIYSLKAKRRNRHVERALRARERWLGRYIIFNLVKLNGVIDRIGSTRVILEFDDLIEYLQAS